MIALGTMTWGRETPEAEARRIYEAARTAGVTWFDTASLYSDGESERILGRCLRDDPAASEVHVSTKGGYRGQHLGEELDGSLRRLGLGHVELYFAHHWHRHRSPEAIDTLARARQDGLARSVGLSNATAWEAALDGPQAGIGALQVHYNLWRRTADVELLPLALHMGWRVFGYSPLAAGTLTGKYRGTRRPVNARLAADGRYAMRYCECLHTPDVSDLSLRSGGITAAGLALSWVQSKGVVPIVGARTVAQLETMVPLSDVADTVLDDLEDRFPSPPHPLDRPEEA